LDEENTDQKPPASPIMAMNAPPTANMPPFNGNHCIIAVKYILQGLGSTEDTQKITIFATTLRKKGVEWFKKLDHNPDTKFQSFEELDQKNLDEFSQIEKSVAGFSHIKSL
jgi:hypothetical protein